MSGSCTARDERERVAALQEDSPRNTNEGEAYGAGSSDWIRTNPPVHRRLSRSLQCVEPPGTSPSCRASFRSPPVKRELRLASRRDIGPRLSAVARSAKAEGRELAKVACAGV
jgi:hypothetical protein